MESIRPFVFCIFGISLLPKIYSDIFPSLFLIKESDKSYVLADKFTYAGDERNALRFSRASIYPLYNACPERNAPLHDTYALQVQGPVTDFEPKPFEQFFKGFFIKYNCPSPVKPIVLKFKDSLRHKFTPEGAQLYDIGFLIHKKNGKFEKIWEIYETLTEEYDVINFLTITMDKSSETIISVRYMIISGRILPPNPDPATFQSNEKNFKVYGFDVDSLYTEKNQAKIFSSIFGQSSSIYNDYPDRSLLKVQLAPHEDFLLNIWKSPSFMDLNTAAMWSQLQPQWEKIEIFVRRVAQDLAALMVETGTAKILTLSDANGLSQEVYLREGQKSPVSKYFWKLVSYNQVSDGKTFTNAILIIIHNDPYTSDQKPICQDMSKDSGWDVSNEDYETGLTYVCPVDEDIVSKLYDEFKMKYEILNLNDLQKLDYDEKGEEKWVNENIAERIRSRL